MDFISNQSSQVEEMLRLMGLSSLSELFQDIPSSLLQKSPSMDDGLSEMEGLKLLKTLASKNSFHLWESYMGAGSYEHHIPAIVSSITSKSEFLTSYTPYHAEASQGLLQAIFEFQSVVVALTGMDVANASVYDGASATAEAALMMIRKSGKEKVLVSESVHPYYRAVLHQYLASFQVETIPTVNGVTDQCALSQQFDTKTAAVIIQSPNFFGIIESVQSESLILVANPLSYGLFKTAKEVGAMIAVGDMQTFGIPMQFGGPYAGYMACQEELMRELPGRIVGETVDQDGMRGFVLTLQAREQHIRREKATSNICTNQALAALASLVTILWYGKEGVKKLALTNFQRATYLKEELKKQGAELLSERETFNEFALRLSPKTVEKFYKAKIFPGIPLEKFYPTLKDFWLVAVTETKNKQQLDHYLSIYADNL